MGKAEGIQDEEAVAIGQLGADMAAQLGVDGAVVVPASADAELQGTGVLAHIGSDAAQ